jgi:predicted RND superfamily exporter protein
MNQPFFSRRIRIGRNYHVSCGFLIMVALTFTLPLIWMGQRRALLSNRNDVKEWLPENFLETATHHWFQKHFPHEQFVLVSWPGCTLDDDRLELFARKLVPVTEPEAPPGTTQAQSTREPTYETKYFRNVLTGQRLIKDLQARYPELSEKQIFRRLEGSLIGKDHNKTCLVVTLAETYRGKELRAVLETLRVIARECNIEPVPKPDTRNFVAKAAGHAGAFVKEIVVGRNPAHDGIRMGGPPVDNSEIDREGERTLMRLAGLSALVGLGISYLCFRSVRLTLMVFSIAVLAAGAGLALVFFASLFYSHATVDAILLSMPSLVYVLAISGAIHIINYYHDAIRDNGLTGAPELALRHGWIPCSLAALTTSLGLGSLCSSDLIPIAKFGFFSALGVLATLVLLFLVLPACLSLWPSRKFAEELASRPNHDAEDSIIVRSWQKIGGFVVGHNRLVSAGCLVLMVVFAVGLSRMQTSVKLMKLFSDDARIIYDYGWLEHHIGPLVPMEVVIRVDNEKCKLNLVQRMRMARDVEYAIERRLPEDVGGALSAATMAPDIGKTSRRADVRLGYSTRDSATSRRIDKHRDKFQDYLTVDMDSAERKIAEGTLADPTLAELGITGENARRLEAGGLKTLTAIAEHCRREADEAETNNPIRENLVSVRGIGPEQAAVVAERIDHWRVAHGEELWRVSARVWALTDLDYSLFVSTVRNVVENVLDSNYRRPLDAAGRPAQNKYGRPLAGIEGIEVTYTGLVPLVYKAQHALMDGLYKSLAMAFALIAIVMMLVLRSFSAGMLSMIPNIFPVVIIFGGMSWMGILIDVGSMMTASVALGVAVDDTLHYLFWFRHGLDDGHDRKGAAMFAYKRCATAMTQTTLIGGLGLAVFAVSTFTPTQRFGVLMLAMLSAALVGDLIFLPALLTSPLGRFFDRSRHRRKPTAKNGLPPDDAQAPLAECAEDADIVPLESEPATLPLHANRRRRSHKAS